MFTKKNQNRFRDYLTLRFFLQSDVSEFIFRNDLSIIILKIRNVCLPLTQKLREKNEGTFFIKPYKLKKTKCPILILRFCG